MKSITPQTILHEEIHENMICKEKEKIKQSFKENEIRLRNLEEQNVSLELCYNKTTKHITYIGLTSNGPEYKYESIPGTEATDDCLSIENVNCWQSTLPNYKI